MSQGSSGNTDQPFESCAEGTRWQPLISEFIDGELEHATSQRVNTHLAGCAACCHFMEELAAIEMSLSELQYSAPDSPSERTESNTLDEWWNAPQKLPLNSLKPVQPGDVTPRGSNLLRWMPIAAAASVLAGLGMIAMTPGAELTAEEFVEPAAEVQMMHHQRELNQELLVNTLDLDLRALRRELSFLGGGSQNEDEQKQRIAESIEQLIEKVNRLKTTSKNTFEYSTNEE